MREGTMRKGAMRFQEGDLGLIGRINCTFGMTSSRHKPLSSVDVRVVLEMFPGGIVCDVEQLSAEVVFIAYAVFVITLQCRRSAENPLCGSAYRVAAHELNTLCRADIDSRRDEDVNVVRQDGEGVKEKLAGVTVASRSDAGSALPRQCAGSAWRRLLII